MRDNKSEPATKADLKELEQKLGGRIGSLEKKTDSLEKKTDSMEKKIDSLEKKTDSLGKKVDSLGKKVDSLDKKIESVEITVKHLSVELTKTQADVREIKHDMATKMATKDDVSRIMAHIDGFAAQALSYNRHDTIRGAKIMEHESKIENHEGRLVLLEKPE